MNWRSEDFWIWVLIVALLAWYVLEQAFGLGTRFLQLFEDKEDEDDE